MLAQNDVLYCKPIRAKSNLSLTQFIRRECLESLIAFSICRNRMSESEGFFLFCTIQNNSTHKNGRDEMQG